MLGNWNNTKERPLPAPNIWLLGYWESIYREPFCCSVKLTPDGWWIAKFENTDTVIKAPDYWTFIKTPFGR